VNNFGRKGREGQVRDRDSKKDVYREASEGARWGGWLKKGGALLGTYRKSGFPRRWVGGPGTGGGKKEAAELVGRFQTVERMDEPCAD